MDTIIRQKIAIRKILLDKSNPRIEEQSSQSEVIEALCTAYNIGDLAKDIVSYGLNPLELFAVLRERVDDSGGSSTYTVLEGNRRLCALKLLDRPTLGPATVRSKFKELSKNYTRIDKVSCIIFEDREDARIWLARLHGGAQSGLGRYKWNSDAKERFTNSKKNALALAFLDFAQTANWIDQSERQGLLTTAQRFLLKPALKEILGINYSSQGGIKRLVSYQDFSVRGEAFVTDLKDRLIVNSRMNAREITKYAMDLAARIEVDGTPIAPVALHNASVDVASTDAEESDFVNEDHDNADNVKRAAPSTDKEEAENLTQPQQQPNITANNNEETSGSNDARDVEESSSYIQPKPKVPSQPEEPTQLVPSQQVSDLIGTTTSIKVSHLCYSLHTINIKDHSMLISVGVWILLETLGKAHGNTGSNDFSSYFNKQKLTNIGFIDKGERRDIIIALEYFRDHGNMTKHSATAGSLNPSQLVVYYKTLQPLIAKVLPVLK